MEEKSDETFKCGDTVCYDKADGVLRLTKEGDNPDYTVDEDIEGGYCFAFAGRVYNTCSRSVWNVISTPL